MYEKELKHDAFNDFLEHNFTWDNILIKMTKIV